MRNSIRLALAVALALHATATPAGTTERIFASGIEATPDPTDCTESATTPAAFAERATMLAAEVPTICVPPGTVQGVDLCTSSTPTCDGCEVTVTRTSSILLTTDVTEQLDVDDSFSGTFEARVFGTPSCGHRFTGTAIGLAVYRAERLGLDALRLDPRTTVDGGVFLPGFACSAAVRTLFQDFLMDAYLQYLEATTPTAGDVCRAN